jgi:hypothetical protein
VADAVAIVDFPPDTDVMGATLDLMLPQPDWSPTRLVSLMVMVAVVVIIVIAIAAPGALR